jgi:hypothetical protein
MGSLHVNIDHKGKDGQQVCVPLLINSQIDSVSLEAQYGLPSKRHWFSEMAEGRRLLGESQYVIESHFLFLLTLLASFGYGYAWLS